MTGADVLEVGQDAIVTLLLICGPVLGVGLTVGVSVALFQTLTSINEMTLTFVPKVFAVFITLLYSLPYFGRLLMGFMDRISERIISGG